MNNELKTVITEINNLRCKLNNSSLVLLNKNKKDCRDIIDLSKKMDILITKYTILNKK
ncbi:MAG: hypothetical protein N2448_01090 [Caloramator sp.]|nr:hypothetical protein [Caloramator sp.]